MELKTIKIEGHEHHYLFEREDDYLFLKFNWISPFEGRTVTQVPLRAQSEETIRANVMQYGFYSDDKLRSTLFKFILNHLIIFYNYPMAYNILNLPNRELFVVSWADSTFKKEEVETLVDMIFQAEFEILTKQEQEDEVESVEGEADEIIIIDDSDEVIEEVDDREWEREAGLVLEEGEKS